MSKKKKYVQLVFLKNDLQDAGAGLRMNLMHILMKAAAICCDGEYKDSGCGASVMLIDEPMDEDVAQIEKYCVNYINYTGFFSPQQLDEIAQQLADRCKERGLKLGIGTLLHQSEMYTMRDEFTVWNWEH